MSNYSKHKDRAPQDTIFEIQRILNKIGLFPVLHHAEKEFDGAYSNRVSLYPTSLGTNGKGTDELFATASGYGELMERIQNNMLQSGGMFRYLKNYGGFFCFHDEKEITLTELIEQEDSYLDNVFRIMGKVTSDEKLSLLRELNESIYNRTDDKVIAVPFVDVTGNRLVWLPLHFVYCLCGSNGMAAGNTLEEAFVQAMSEIFERYVNAKVIKGEVVPPEIPREYLKDYSFWSLIEQIESGGNYEVSVRDCSLGKNYPVTATIIVDKSHGTFGIKFGAHPSFAVSVERNLTEALQGKKMRFFTAQNLIGNDSDATQLNNVPNVTKVGSGVYSARLFSDKPDWEFKPWDYWAGLSNLEFFKKMLAIIEGEGCRPLFRNSSHLGFPSCYILVPGFSETFPMNETRIREFWTASQVNKSISHFPDLNSEEEERLLRLLRFKEYSAVDSRLRTLMNRPIKEGFMSLSRIGAFLALKQGLFKKAIHFFQKVKVKEQNENERLYLDCLTEYTRLLSRGIDRTAALKVIKKLFRDEIADRVIYEVEDPAEMMRRVFPKMNCYDCENCEMSKKYCAKLDEEKVFMKIKDALAKSTVSQENLLDYFKNL